MPSRAVLITGAAGGLGAVMTAALLKDGHAVAAVDRSREGLARLTAALGAGRERLLPVEAELADPAACAQAVDTAVAHFGRLEAVVNGAAPDAQIFGAAAPRVANTTFFAIPGLKAETAQIAFDLAGVALSAGSACSSGKVGPSHVLKAMGFGDGAGALRVSIGRATGDAEAEAFRAALAGIMARIGKDKAA